MKIINYTQARLNLRKMIDEVVESKTPTCIVSKNNQVVVISKAKYDELIRGNDENNN